MKNDTGARWLYQGHTVASLWQSKQLRNARTRVDGVSHRISRVAAEFVRDVGMNCIASSTATSANPTRAKTRFICAMVVGFIHTPIKQALSTTQTASSALNRYHTNGIMR